MAGGARVSVSGTSEVIASLLAMGRQANDLDAFDAIARRMKGKAIALAPHSTGALARSIDAKVTRNKSTVSAGGPSRRSHGGGVYAPIAEYGTYTHRSKGPRPFMRRALESSEEFARQRIENELDRIIGRLDLNGV